MKIALATNLDDTLIFSKEFIERYSPDAKYSKAESRDNHRDDKFIANKVRDALQRIESEDYSDVIPVTSKSIEEYKKINLGFKPKYAIVASGGVILKDGEPIKEYEEYTKRELNPSRLANVAMDINCLYSISDDCKLIDNKYIIADIDNMAEFKDEILTLMYKYSDFSFNVKQGKLYIVPYVCTKAVALRWLQLTNFYNKIVAIGSSELDVNMLYIADYALVPKHGELVKNNIVHDATFTDAGIECALTAVLFVDALVNKIKGI